MKKLFQEPTMQVIVFGSSDLVIVTSGDDVSSTRGVTSTGTYSVLRDDS